MKMLETRTEIATTVNFKKMPVITFDLSKKDEYGWSGTKVNIDNGTFRDGEPYYIHAEIRTYKDTNCLEFATYGVCLSSSWSYYDIVEILEYSNAPVVKADQDILIFPINTETKKAYKPVVLHTGERVNPHCMTPLGLEKFYLAYEPF